MKSFFSPDVSVRVFCSLAEDQVGQGSGKMEARNGGIFLTKTNVSLRPLCLCLVLCDFNA